MNAIVESGALKALNVTAKTEVWIYDMIENHAFDIANIAKKQKLEFRTCPLCGKQFLAPIGGNPGLCEECSGWKVQIAQEFWNVYRENGWADNEIFYAQFARICQKHGLPVPPLEQEKGEKTENG